MLLQDRDGGVWRAADGSTYVCARGGLGDGADAVATLSWGLEVGDATVSPRGGGADGGLLAGDVTLLFWLLPSLLCALQPNCTGEEGGMTMAPVTKGIGRNVIAQQFW